MMPKGATPSALHTDGRAARVAANNTRGLNFIWNPLLHFAGQRRRSRIMGFRWEGEKKALQMRNLLQQLTVRFPFCDVR